MVLGYKHPVGPLALTDIVGLDVRLGIAEYLEKELGPRFAPRSSCGTWWSAVNWARSPGRASTTTPDAARTV